MNLRPTTIKTLTVTLGLLAVVLAGSLFADSTDLELCRKTAEQVQCELSADATRDQCIDQANGDPDAIFLCELDWWEAQQVCETIPPRCDYNVP
jgi:hypothetical protein